MLQRPKPVQKLSKDELIDQLQQQNKYLMGHLQKQQEDGFYKRLDYLFKIVENAKLFIELDKDFVLKSVAEIVDTITIPVPEPQTKECDSDCDCAKGVTPTEEFNTNSEVTSTNYSSVVK